MLPESRRPLLRDLLKSKSPVRLIEAHNGLSAIIGAQTQLAGKRFDGIWISSFTESMALGFPDAEIVGFESRLSLIQQICMVCSLPLLVDGDTGGTTEQLRYRVRVLEQLGASGIVVEDKNFPKRNSFDENACQELQDSDLFAAKLRAATRTKRSTQFMIVARTEALVLGASMEEALTRANKYVDAGADAILVHSRAKCPTEVMQFATTFRLVNPQVPLVCVPTSYNRATDTDLAGAGFSIIVHANHLLRSAAHAMTRTAEKILADDSSHFADADCLPMSRLIEESTNRFEEPWTLVSSDPESILV